jgi:hypothetical protein
MINKLKKLFKKKRIVFNVDEKTINILNILCKKGKFDNKEQLLKDSILLMKTLILLDEQGYKNIIAEDYERNLKVQILWNPRKQRIDD